MFIYLLSDEAGLAGSAAGHRFHPGLTGRGVTIATLMTDNIIEAGEKVMSLEYLVSLMHSAHPVYYLL